MHPSEPKISYQDTSMDRSLSPQQIRRQNVRRGLMIGIALFLLIITFIGLRSWLRKTVDPTTLRYSVAELGVVENSFQASGKVVPQFEQNLISPLRGLIEEVHFSVGEQVPKGSSLLKLNLAESQNEFQDKMDQLAVQKLKLAQTRSQQKKNLIDIESSLEIELLEIKNMQKELTDEKYLEKIGGSTQDKVDQIQNNLLIKEKEKDKLKRNISYQKEYNHTELQSLEYDMALLQRDMEAMQKKFRQAEIRTEREGIISYINSQVGNYINAGEVVAKLTDFSQFKVEAQVSTEFANQLIPGLRAKVRIQDTDLGGIVTQVSPNVEGGALKFWVQLDSANHSVLRPNLSAEVFVINSFRDGVIRVKNGPFYEGGKTQQIFIVKGDKAYRREATVGASNFDYLEIVEGLEEGEKIIINDMSAHVTLEEVLLRK